MTELPVVITDSILLDIWAKWETNWFYHRFVFFFFLYSEWNEECLLSWCLCTRFRLENCSGVYSLYFMGTRFLIIFFLFSCYSLAINYDTHLNYQYFIEFFNKHSTEMSPFSKRLFFIFAKVRTFGRKFYCYTSLTIFQMWADPFDLFHSFFREQMYKATPQPRSSSVLYNLFSGSTRFHPEVWWFRIAIVFILGAFVEAFKYSRNLTKKLLQKKKKKRQQRYRDHLNFQISSIKRWAMFWFWCAPLSYLYVREFDLSALIIIHHNHLLINSYYLFYKKIIPSNSAVQHHRPFICTVSSMSQLSAAVISCPHLHMYTAFNRCSSTLDRINLHFVHFYTYTIHIIIRDLYACINFERSRKFLN